MDSERQWANHRGPGRRGPDRLSTGRRAPCTGEEVRFPGGSRAPRTFSLKPSSPKFPLPQEGMALMFLTKARFDARVFWLQGEGDPQQIESALLPRGRRRDFVELDGRV